MAGVLSAYGMGLADVRRFGEQSVLKPYCPATLAELEPVAEPEPYPFRDLHPYIRQLVDAFGPRRVFWGTDLTRMPCPYRECVTLFTEELPWLRGADLEWVMGRGVCEWLGWPLPAA